MIIKQTLLQLTTARNYPINPSLFPSLTHMRIMNFQTETPRIMLGKAGDVEVWCAFGYMDGGIFWEAPGKTGMHFVVDEPEIYDLADYFAKGVNIIGIEIYEVILQFLLDIEVRDVDTQEQIPDGTIVINEYEIPE